MAKEEAIEVEGIVREALPNTLFRANCRTAISSSPTFRANAKTLYPNRPGDKVRVGLSPYDLSRGRIIYREK